MCHCMCVIACVTYLHDFVTVLMKCVAVLAISSTFMELEFYALHVTKGGNETSQCLKPYAACSLLP